MKPYYNYSDGSCVKSSKKGELFKAGDQVEGTDWQSHGKVKRAKDCKHICGDDGYCSAFDFNKSTGICRLWLTDIKEKGSGDTNIQCGVKHTKPNDDAPQKEKDKFEAIEKA